MTKQTAFGRGPCESRGGCDMGQIRRIGPMRLLVVAALCALPRVASAKVVAIPLNDYTRLGQRFTAGVAFDALEVTVPSWLDAEGGLTLALWDSPQRKKAFGRQAFTNIRDNAWVALRFARPLPAGAYYWEVSDRTGKTRVGLWADILPNETDDCIYLDGKPDRKKRFRFRTTPTAFPYTDTQQMLAVLKSDAPAATRIEAARQLAAMGGAEAVPELARLLTDAKRSHLARFALQAMPGPDAAAALRHAAPALKRALLIGVINSLGERRDAESVGLLRGLLRDTDPHIARAAAEALGKIGTLDAADALEKAMANAPAKVRPAVHQGLLDCAQRLAASGRRSRAAALYHALRNSETSPAARAAAMRGAILARGAAGVPLLLKQIESDDSDRALVALWIVARELPGAETTRALTDELSKLSLAKQAMLARALCSRGDEAALPELLRLAAKGQKNVRLAGVRGLSQMPNPAVTAALVEMLSDPDKEIADAAQQVLVQLRGNGVDAAVTKVLERGPTPVRLRAIQLLAARRVFDARPQLLDAARDDDPEVRLAALKVLRTLAGPADVDSLLSILLSAGAPRETEAAKRALLAASRGISDTGPLVAKLVSALPKAQPRLKQAILRVLHHIGGNEAGNAILAAIDAPDASVKATALRLLGEWRSAELAPALLRLAAASADAHRRLLCLRAYLRWAGRPTLSDEDRLFMCRMAAPLVGRPEETKLLLSTLGRLATPDALPLATPHLDDPATRREAASAILAIAGKLSGGADATLVQALRKVVQSGAGADLASRAQALLAKRQARKR